MEQVGITEEERAERLLRNAGRLRKEAETCGPIEAGAKLREAAELEEEVEGIAAALHFEKAGGEVEAAAKIREKLEAS